MNQCLYISTARQIAPDMLARLVASSQANNARDGITGFLLYNGRNFMQLIEGQGSALQNLLVRLMRDDRHSGMALLLNEPIMSRACPDWAMQQIRLEASVPGRKEAIAQILPAGLPPHVRALVSNFALLN